MDTVPEAVIKAPELSALLVKPDDELVGVPALESVASTPVSTSLVVVDVVWTAPVEVAPLALFTITKAPTSTTITATTISTTRRIQ